MPNPFWDYDPITLSTTRSLVRGALEEATGQALSLLDPSPDTLMTEAQALGIPPARLLVWIRSHSSDSKPETWTAAALKAWREPEKAPSCERCGASVEDPDSHECEAA